MYTARHSQTLDSQLQAEQDTLVQRAMCHMLHSTLLWTFMAFSFSGRDGSHMAGIWWTKPCTQAHGASHGPEGEGALGKSNKLWLQFGLSLGPKLTNSYNILFTTSERITSVFWSFPQDPVWHRKWLKSWQPGPGRWGKKSPWTVPMKQVCLHTIFFGTSSFRVERWISSLVSILVVGMQGEVAILSFSRNQSIASASSFQT
jgi:hypothetical protein